MRSIRTQTVRLAVIFLGLAGACHAQTPSQGAKTDLSGTSWQLVKFQGSNDTTLAPGNASKYTIAFDSSGSVSVRIDCNRGHGSWNSAGANQIQFGPMALTRAMCPSAALNDRLVKDWQYIRSYTMKGGHLVLSLMADGGTYEFQPMTFHSSASGRANEPAPESAEQEFALQGLPASFVGTVPCADCPGIHYRLDLSPDHTFSSQMTYEERDGTFNDSGRWELANNRILVLQGKSKITEKFSVRDANTLRKLDVNGNEIVSQFNYDLKRVSQPVPGESQAATDVPLENTHWTLSAINNASVANSEQTEAFFVLDPEQHRVSGSGGCNRLMGSYELNGDQLKFGQTAGTMMMCPQGMDTEQAFLKSFGQVSRWKITGESLELFDSDGKVVARFTAGQK